MRTRRRRRDAAPDVSAGGVGVTAFEAARGADLGVGPHDGLELGGRRAVEDDAVGARRELVEDRGPRTARAEPTAAGSHSSGMSVWMCSSWSIVATASMAPGTDCTTASARNRSRGAGSQPFMATRASP